MSIKKVCIQWERYPIYEDIGIQRCFNCQEYYHKNNTCHNKTVCEYCSGDHNIKECNKRHKKCLNCENANKKFNLDYDINHGASDKDCPSYKYLIQVLRNKIDYGHTNGK